MATKQTSAMGGITLYQVELSDAEKFQLLVDATVNTVVDLGINPEENPLIARVIYKTTDSIHLRNIKFYIRVDVSTKQAFIIEPYMALPGSYYKSSMLDAASIQLLHDLINVDIPLGDIEPITNSV